MNLNNSEKVRDMIFLGGGKWKEGVEDWQMDTEWEGEEPLEQEEGLGGTFPVKWSLTTMKIILVIKRPTAKIFQQSVRNLTLKKLNKGFTHG